MPFLSIVLVHLTLRLKRKIVADLKFQIPDLLGKRQGPGECPQLIPQDSEILVPAGVNRDIKVNGANLPDDNRVCLLNIVCY